MNENAHAQTDCMRYVSERLQASVSGDVFADYAEHAAALLLRAFHKEHAAENAEGAGGAGSGAAGAGSAAVEGKRATAAAAPKIAGLPAAAAEQQKWAKPAERSADALVKLIDSNSQLHERLVSSVNS